MLEFTPLSDGIQEPPALLAKEQAAAVLVTAEGSFWTRIIGRGCSPTSRVVWGLARIESVEDFVRSPAAIRAMGEALARSERGRTPAWVLRAVEQIERGRVASLAKLADSLGIHRVHFARTFAANIGFAPSAFRSIVRVCSAMRVIERGEARLASAARQVGYAHQSHMTREFRTMLGITPGEWRWRAFAST